MKQTKCWISALIFFYLFGLLIFFRGYFIDRRYLLDKSQGIGKKTQPVIILIIDSFRIDLAMGEYFTFFKNMTRDHPQQSLLFLAFAEVPTVTGPRLQAMTSGNFPPLSKLLDNFHASEIVEDNIMYQMKRLERKTFFTGDNTWMGLYPNSFTEQHPKASFNIGDMHSVDIYNEENIVKNLNKEFDLIVAHFLGLDHAGHRNNKVIKNPDLNDKLKQLNLIVQNIYDKMSNDTILIVAGDHGMADDGNHGGNSTEETNTLFFAVRKEGNFYPNYMDNIPELADTYQSNLVKRKKYIRKISQIDVVPTLAHLLGVPIPFSNLGYIINEFFNSEEYCQNNLEQIWNFVQAVHTRQGKFSYTQINQWEQQYKKVNNCKDALILMNEIQFTARRIWNEYDIPLLNLSFILQFFIIILFILVMCGLYYSQENEQTINIQQITATIKYFLATNKKLTIILSLGLGLLYFIYEMEIIITIILIFAIIYVDFFLFIKVRKDYVIYQERCKKSIIGNPEELGFIDLRKNTVLDQNQYQASSFYIKYISNFIQICIFLLFLYKIFQQGNLLLSIENKKKEEKYLYDELNMLLLLGSIISIMNQIFKLTVLEEENPLWKQLLWAALPIISMATLYYTIQFEQFYLNSKNYWFLEKTLYQYYLPALFLHCCFYIYLRKNSMLDKIIAQLGLIFVNLYFILPLKSDEISFIDQEFINIYIPRIVYILSMYYFYSKEIIFLFLSCLVVSDKCGLAIYSYEILTFTFFLFLWKDLIKYSPITYFAIMSLVCQMTWFIFGNKCTISSIKLDRAYIGFPNFSLFVNPLILTMFLIGPFLAALVFIKFINPHLAKLCQLNEKQCKNSINLFKLMFLLNFYIQIQFTQIHSYLNAGGLIDVQFKYIFDAVTFLVVSLLMLLF